MTNDTDNHIRVAADLLDYIDASPSPWHAVETTENRLLEHGFIKLHEDMSWALEFNRGYYVVRDDSSIIAFRMGEAPTSVGGFNIVGAHTDSPALRVKPNGSHKAGSMVRVGVEVYGGLQIATYADRDLSLAGRITYSHEGQLITELVRFDEALLRLPTLAIHMNRMVNEEGLKFNAQTEIPLYLTCAEDNLPSESVLKNLIADEMDIKADQIKAWELNVYDTQPGAFWGPDSEFIANSQFDNLASCHAALTALLNSNEPSDTTRVIAFFDHEEIGSNSFKGADGNFMRDVLERITSTFEEESDAFDLAIARSFLISADMAHAAHPNFPNAYEPDHLAIMNQGPVIKVNQNVRYTTTSKSEARFMALCEKADVPCQKYVHRTNLACGSTIGPLSSSILGIESVDVGNPMWAMHSARESAGTHDHEYMIKALEALFSE